MSQQEEWDVLLTRALSSPIGVLVRTSDTTRALRALGEAKSRDPGFAGLAFRRNPWALDGDEVFILRAGAGQAQEAEDGGRVPTANDI